MNYKRTVVMALVAMLSCAGGCGTVGTRWSRLVSPPDSERNFDGALEQLRGGNEQKARDQLAKVISAQPQPGVTDEALFRQALLSLRDEGGKGEAQSQALLERLRREYPDSIWNRQAAPLAAYLRANQRIRERNLSLTRDNKELRQSMERLKNLDLELEQRIRR